MQPDDELDELVANVLQQMRAIETAEQQAVVQTLRTVAALPAITTRDKRHRRRIQRLLAALDEA